VVFFGQMLVGIHRPMSSVDGPRLIRHRSNAQDGQTIYHFRVRYAFSARNTQTGRLQVLLWLAQGKTNGEIATILGNSESTVKKHVLEIFDKLGVETRTAASLFALEVLSSPAAHG